MGGYCLLDLRRHTGENDKIRPNKNHAGENGDRNAFIVYSDVITSLPPLFMAEAVEPDQDGLFPRRYPESEYKQVPLYEVPEFTMEELADMIVKDRGYGDVRKYFTPETIRRMRG